MARIVVSAIRPDHFIHAHAFDEVYESVVVGLRNLGFSVDATENTWSVDTPTILFGAHLLSADSLKHMPAHVILYNLEQADPKAQWLQGPYPQALQSHEVWDFSDVNALRLRQAGVAPRILWCPVGYVRELDRIPKNLEEDIDVLFYGSLNARRQAVLDALRARGLHVVHSFGLYGRERDQLVSRSKIVLNVHYYESGIFEWVRVFYLLINRRLVVSETSILTAYDRGIENVVEFAPYEHLVDRCWEMAHDPARRENKLQTIPMYMALRQEEVILKSVLRASFVGPPPNSHAP
jgi:hypothetical protein